MEMISPSVCSTCLINKNCSGKVFQNREITLEAIDNKSARHAAEYLFRDHAVSMWMIPEEARTLAAMDRDVDLVLEVLPRVNVDEDIVAVPFG